MGEKGVWWKGIMGDTQQLMGKLKKMGHGWRISYKLIKVNIKRRWRDKRPTQHPS